MTPSPACLAMIERLIGYDTTSRDSNLALIHDVRDYLAEHGVESRLVHDETGAKANLYAVLGPADKPGIMLSGHTDVVPVDGQPWDTDPFRLVQKDGRLYGRGTCDMKSFLAVTLALVPEMQARGLHTPIWLALSYDEEVGCIGVRRLIAQMEEMPVKPTACIVGEPTDMKVVIAHKGKKSFYCTVHGHECHSSVPQLGVNAVEAAAEVVAHLKGMARRFRDSGPYDPMYDPPYTTVHTGVIRGGTALNIVPLECTFEFEWRYLPDQDPDALLREIQAVADALLPEMHAVAPNAGFTWTERSEFPGLDTPPDAAVTTLAKTLSGGNDVYKVGFGTEAGLFQKAGIPTIVCGPGSIEQAHKPNEFVTLDQVARCEQFLRRLMDQVGK